MCQYRRIWQYSRIFLRFLLQIILWTSWMTSFSRLNFPNLLLSTFIWLRLAEYLILRILMILFIRTYCKTSYKIEKLFDTWRHYERLRVLNKKIYFCPHIAESAIIAENAQYPFITFWLECVATTPFNVWF
jgi:hypothetical protein